MTGNTSCAANLYWHPSSTDDVLRARQFGHRPLTVWITGLSGSGKSTIAYELARRLTQARCACVVLDGDNLRHRLNSDLGFSDSDRRENIRRTAEVARLMNEAGLIVIASLVSPRRADRALAAEIVGERCFAEVYVSTSLEVCEARDPNGLYRRARLGEIRDFTGVSSPYEQPLDPALELDTATLSPAEAAALLHTYLTQREAQTDDIAAA